MNATVTFEYNRLGNNWVAEITQGDVIIGRAVFSSPVTAWEWIWQQGKKADDCNNAYTFEEEYRAR